MGVLAAFSFAKLWKDILSWLLDPKNWVKIAVAIALVYGSYKLYNWIWDRGHDSRNEEVATLHTQITTLTGERDAAVQRKQEFETAWTYFVKKSNEAIQQMARDFIATNTRIRKQLATAQKSLAEKEKQRALIPKYVTPAADARCVVPAGFVSVFNQSLEGTAAPADDAGGQVAGGGSGNVEAPSGIALSEVTDVVASNNAEAVHRGVIIKQWQTWYAENKDSFEKAQQAKAEAIPRVIEAETQLKAPEVP